MSSVSFSPEHRPTQYPSRATPAPGTTVQTVADDASSPGDEQLVELLQRYLTILQRHPGAEEMMDEVPTEGFETGSIGGHVWKGLDGLRDFLSQRHGFLDEKHTIEELRCRTDPRAGRSRGARAQSIASGP